MRPIKEEKIVKKTSQSKSKRSYEQDGLKTLRLIHLKKHFISSTMNYLTMASVAFWIGSMYFMYHAYREIHAREANQLSRSLKGTKENFFNGYLENIMMDLERIERIEGTIKGKKYKY